MAGRLSCLGVGGWGSDLCPWCLLWFPCIFLCDMICTIIILWYHHNPRSEIRLGNQGLPKVFQWVLWQNKDLRNITFQTSQTLNYFRPTQMGSGSADWYVVLWWPIIAFPVGFGVQLPLSPVRTPVVRDDVQIQIKPIARNHAYNGPHRLSP